jgi:GT2 family glycosyltransferase
VRAQALPPSLVRVWHNGPIFPPPEVAGARIESGGANLGFGEGINRLLERAQDEIAVVANPDLVLDPGCVAALERALRESEAVVAGGTLLSPEGIINACGLHLTWDLLGINTDRGKAAPARSEYLGPSGALFAVNRVRWERLGGGPLFPRSLFLYLEDVALGLKLRSKGAEIRFCPQARATHGWSVSTGQRSALKLYYVERNRLWICRALWGGRTWATLPFSALRFAAYAWARKGRREPGESAAFGRAWADGLVREVPEDVRAYFAGVRVPRGYFARMSEQLRNPVA